MLVYFSMALAFIIGVNKSDFQLINSSTHMLFFNRFSKTMKIFYRRTNSICRTRESSRMLLLGWCAA